MLDYPKLAPTNIGLRAYGGNAVAVGGCLNANVVYKNIKINLPLIFVDVKNGTNILGLDWITALGFTVMNTKDGTLEMQQINTSHHVLMNGIEVLCEQYKTIFDDSLGTAKNFEAHLTLKPDVTPKYQKARPLPFALMDPVKKELQRLVDNKIIGRIQTSVNAAPIVPVKKANGSLRICGDFKAINSQLEIDRHPIPRIDELFTKLQGGELFSKVDLSEAYLQIPLDEASQKLMVINTPFRLYKYLRLQFGVASAPSIFQRKMDEMVAGIPNCAPYLDDVIVTGRTVDEHLSNLEKLFTRLEENGIKCRKEKCVFGKPEVEYLGHIIFASGIRPSGSNVKAIRCHDQII